MTEMHPPSATIYQFPRQRSGNAARVRRPLLDQQVAAVEFGSGWYHDAAVAAERPRAIVRPFPPRPR